MTRPLVDDDHRTLAKTALDQSVFLAAGAGTGKSTTLVNRILETLQDDTRPVLINEIAAITFTEKAGAELRHRLRKALAEACAQPGVDQRLRNALVDVDTAQVGTIHSFAQRILRRFALEASLPLGFVVVADVDASRAKRQRAREVVASTHQLREIDRVVRMYQVKMGNLLELIERLDDLSLRITPEALDANRCTDVSTYRERALTNIARFILRFESDCMNDDDLLSQKLHDKSTELMNVLGSAGTDELAVLHGLRIAKKLDFFKISGGSSKNYRMHEPQYWRDEWKALSPDVHAVFVAPLEEAIRQLLEHAGRELSAARDVRRHNGEIEYDDLLSMADELVQSDTEVRRRLHSEIKVMLIDEFQDTDPVQWSLIQRITADPADPEHRPLPRRLVVVGDPKQAIYSFRGADVNTYTGALGQFVSPTDPLGIRLELSSNFRTVKPIIDWVNKVFASSMNTPTQVGYEPLSAVHEPNHPNPGPSVLVLRDPIAEAGEPRRDSKVIEAELIANSIKRAVVEKWQTTERAVDGDRAYKGPANYKDVAVLYPTRTSLNALLNAFDDAGIPYRSSDATLVLDRPAVLGLIHALRTIADPSNALSLWLTLKTPLFGCTDTDLMDFRQRGGHWRGNVDDSLLDNRTAKSISVLNNIRRRSGDAQPVHIINALVKDTRILEVLALAPRGNFDTDCIRMLLTHAQQWQDEGGLGLIEYVETLEDMLKENSRLTLPAPDDQDDDAVELMTVFAAKGLEFPIVALAGMTTKRFSKRPTIGIVNPQRIEFSLTKDAESVEYPEWHDGTYRPADDDERMRVLYVACTRAMDHLIVSLCGETNPSSSTSAGALLRPHVPLQDSDVRGVVEYELLATPSPRALAINEAWQQQLERTRETAARAFVALPSGTAAHALGLHVSATSSASFNEPLIEDSTERMTLAARDGAAFGQCLHATMDQIMSGVVGTSDDDIVNAANASLSLVDTNLDVSEISASARAALRAPVVQEALTAPRRWSELYLSAATPDGDVALVEGIADLVFETSANELVVVDYKTDRVLGDESKQHYAEQLACYGELLQRASGRHVVRRVVVHVPGSTATQYEF